MDQMNVEHNNQTITNFHNISVLTNQDADDNREKNEK